MNDNRATRSPSWGLLLLIPAAVILAKRAMRRRAVWESAWQTPGSASRGHGHHGHFEGEGGTSEARTAFRLPPKIEWMLDSWHTRVHETTDLAEPPEPTAPNLA